MEESVVKKGMFKERKREEKGLGKGSREEGRKR